jgi:hypothetical protein
VKRRILDIASLAGTAAILMGGAALWLERPAISADHLDPPERTNNGATSDVAADIADLFLWHTANTVVLAVTGAGPQPQGVAPTYDKDVVYRVHLSNDGDPTTDEMLLDVRYGRNATGDWGVQFVGIPGSTRTISGPVQTQLTDGTVKAEAGLFDDPFFFDLQGFNDTKASGTLSITNTRNFFAGKNDTSFVVEFPQSALAQTGKPLTAWVETRRIASGA